MQKCGETIFAILYLASGCCIFFKTGGTILKSLGISFVFFFYFFEIKKWPECFHICKFQVDTKFSSACSFQVFWSSGKVVDFTYDINNIKWVIQLALINSLSQTRKIQKKNTTKSKTCTYIGLEEFQNTLCDAYVPPLSTSSPRRTMWRKSLEIK